MLNAPAGSPFQNPSPVQDNQPDDALFGFVLDNLTDTAVFAIDPTGRITRWTTAAQAYTGYPSAQVLGKPITCLLPAVWETHVMDNWLNRVKEGPVGFTAPLLTADGSTQICFWKIAAIPPSPFLAVWIHPSFQETEHPAPAENGSVGPVLASVFHGLTQQTSDGFILTDETGLICEWNPAMETITGINRDLVINRPIQVIFTHLEPSHPVDPVIKVFHSQLLVQLSQHAAHPVGKDVTMHVFKRANGAQRWVEILPFSIPTDLGVRSLFICRDITDRYLADQALRISEERFRAFFDQSSEGICLINHNGSIIAWNASAAAITGVPTWNAIGEKCWELAFQIRSALRNAFPGQSFSHPFDQTIEIVLAPAGLPPRIIQQSIFPVQSQSGTLLGILFRDITQLREQEKALRLFQERFTRVFKYSPLPIAIMNSHDRRLLDFNQSFVDFTGAKDGEALLANPEILQTGISIHDFNTFTAFIQQGIAYHDAEIRYQTPSGQVREALLYLEPFEVNGEACVVVMVNDVTFLKKAEADQKEYATRLEILRSIDQAILASRSAAEIAQTTLDWIRLLLNCSWTGLVEFSPGGQHGQMIASSAATDAVDLPQRDLQMSEFFLADQTGVERVRFLPDLTAASGLTRYESQMLAHNLHSAATLAVVMEGSTFGVLLIGAFAPRAFAYDQIEIVTEITDLLAIALHESRLREQTRRRNQELEALTTLSASLRRAETLPRILDILLDTTLQLNQTDIGAIFMPAEDGQIQQTVNRNFFHPAVCNIKSAPSDCFWTLAAQGGPQFIDHFRLSGAPSCVGRAQTQSPFASAAILPLKTGDQLVAVMVIAFDQPRDFSEAEKELFIAMAEIGGNAVFRASVTQSLENRLIERTQILSAIYNVINVASTGPGLSEIYQRSLERTLLALNAPAGSIHLLVDEGQGLKLVAERGMDAADVHAILYLPIPGSPWETILRSPDGLVHTPPNSDGHPFTLGSFQDFYSGALIKTKDSVRGVLSIYCAQQHQLNAEEQALLLAVASQLGEAIERNRLQSLAEENAIMAERQRLARDLHDSVSQSLYALNLFARSSIDALEDGARQNLANSLAEVENNAHQALREMRLLLYALRPSILDQEGLVNALNLRLEAVEKRAGVLYHFNLRGVSVFPRAIEADLYHVAIEALNNALKHSDASQVWVSIDNTGDVIHLSIRDNGRGFNTAEVGSGGMGITTMRERAERMGGRLNLRSSPGKGAQVHLIVPSKSLIPPENEVIG